MDYLGGIFQLIMTDRSPCVCATYLQALVVLEGFAVADLCLLVSTEEPVAHFTEEPCLLDQELHTCGHRLNLSCWPVRSSSLLELGKAGLPTGLLGSKGGKELSALLGVSVFSFFHALSSLVSALSSDLWCFPV